MIYYSTNEIMVSQETDHQLFKIQEENMNQKREDLHEKSNMVSSEHFKRKFGTKIFPYDQSFEQPSFKNT